MDPARWERIKEVFHAALEQPRDEQAAFLNAECADDPELRADVGRLLQEQVQDDDFLKSTSPANLAVTVSRDATPGVDLMFGGTTRFEVRRQLGSGGFGDVYEVYDRERKSPAALKYLRRFRPDQIYRLKKEFRTLTDFRHPNVIRVYELFSNHTPPFFTMEQLNGRDFGEVLRDLAVVPTPVRAHLQPGL